MKNALLLQTMHNHHHDLQDLVNLINENHLFLKTTWLLSGEDWNSEKPNLIVSYNLTSKILKLKLLLPDFQSPWIINTSLKNPVLSKYFLVRLKQFDDLIKLYQLSKQ